MKSLKTLLLVILGAGIGAAGMYYWQRLPFPVFQMQNKVAPANTSPSVANQQTQPSPSPSQVYTEKHKGEDASTGYAIDQQAKPGVRVVSPNGGEKLCLNKPASIKWTANDIKVITLSIKNSDFTYTIGSYPAANGSVSWKVGDILDIGVLPAGASYKIENKSKDEGTNYADVSDKVFTVAKCQ